MCDSEKLTTPGGFGLEWVTETPGLSIFGKIVEEAKPDDVAVIPDEIVELYYARLVKLAQKKLAALPPQVADDEGAVVSALRSFFSGVEQGQFPDLSSDDNLWRVLATITARKSVQQLRKHWKQTGEGDRVVRADNLAEQLAEEPSAEEESMVMEELQQLVQRLEDDTLTKIVYLRLEGFTKDEIAQQLGIHVRSVQRKLKMIKSNWLNE